MPQLDGLKEELLYLRLWLGIIVVAEISVIGVMVAVTLLFAGIALHAGRKK